MLWRALKCIQVHFRVQSNALRTGHKHRKHKLQGFKPLSVLAAGLKAAFSACDRRGTYQCDYL